MTGAAQRFEVGVVGAGPAGSWAARCLAAGGARVALFDASHPREKPCGGGVTERALALLGPAVDPAALPAVPVTTAAFEHPATTAARVTLADGHGAARPPLIVVDRRSFDAAILEAARRAGATHVGARVLDVEAQPHGFLLRTSQGTCAVDHLVGADGANSLVRRRCAAPFSRAQLSIATGCYAHGVAAHDILIGFMPSPAGYVWSFPREDHLAIGICAPASDSNTTALREALRAWIAREAVAGPGGAGRDAPTTPCRHRALARRARQVWYAWPIPSLSAGDWQQPVLAGRGWLLAGDAAGLVDPITREGIFFALQSGAFAAQAILSPEPSRGTAGSYVARVREAILPELVRAARLQHGFFRGAFTRLLVDALRGSPPVRAVMADLVAGRQPYATLKRRLLGTFEVRLAWQLLRLGWRREC